MYSVSQSPTQFSLCLRPVKAWLLCGTLAVTGLGIIVALGRVTTLTCNRFGLLVGTCEITSIGLEGERTHTFHLNEVYGADLDVAYRIMLYTGSAPIALTAPYSGSSINRQIVAARINHFIQNPIAIGFVFHDDGRGFAYPFGLIFLLGSLLVATFFGTVVIYEIDRAQATVTLQHQSFWGRRCHTLALSEVDRLKIEISEGLQGQTDCRICLILRSGHSIPFTPHYTLNPQDAETKIQEVEAFLLSTT
jgi:hypothetical protein